MLYGKGFGGNKEGHEPRPKGWYRWSIPYGVSKKGEYYEIDIVLQKRGKAGLSDFTKEEAESILRQIGNYMANGANFSNLKGEF